MTVTAELMKRIAELSPAKQHLFERRLRDRRSPEPIAIVGVGCRFPGEVTDAESYWQLLHEGVDAVSDIPSDRFDVDALYDPDPDSPGKMSTRWMGALEHPELFDADFFGIPPRDAAAMDPQQRLLLEVSWEAFEHAGLAPDSLQDSPTGVFIGMSNNEYLEIQQRAGGDVDPELSRAGAAHSMSVGRICHLLGLQGPAVPVDTACSSGLVAVHLACQSLRHRECNVALAGGVNVIVNPEMMIAVSKMRMMAPDGRCKAFDEAANGFVRGEGCGLVVLKRLADALAERDNILAVIRGSNVNHDGRSTGLTAPNGRAQEELIYRALSVAKIDPNDVDYVETHGAGTALGDPIEVHALGSIFGTRPPDHPLIIGSVKTNLGHLESAAGVAGLIKTVLALQHRMIPPHLHFRRLNPHIDPERLALRIPTAPLPWRRDEGPRLAGVSSFGLGGTNAHVLLEEAPEVPVTEQEQERPLHIFTLSAKTETALWELTARYEQYFSEHASKDVGDICYTANQGRADLPRRVAAVGATAEDFRTKLAAFNLGKRTSGVMSSEVPSGERPNLVFLFSRGAPDPEVIRTLHQTDPTFRQALDRCEESIKEGGRPSVLEQPRSPGGRILSAFAFQYALAQTWKAWGAEPTAIYGHGIGEYAGACTAGLIGMEDALRLAMSCAAIADRLESQVASLTVFGAPERVADIIEPLRDRVRPSAVYGAVHVELVGEKKAIEEARRKLDESGVPSEPLDGSDGLHSPLVEPLMEAFRDVSSNVAVDSPQVRFLSGCLGDWAGAEQLTREHWSNHLCKTVQFTTAMKHLGQLGSSSLFVEIGGSNELTRVGRRFIEQGTWSPSVSPTRSAWEQLLETLGRAYVHGIPVDWEAFDAERSRFRVALPTYPFQGKPYWLELQERRESAGAGGAGSTATRHPRMARLRTATPVFQAELSADDPSWLGEHRLHGSVVVPAPVFLEMAFAVGSELFSGAKRVTVEDFTVQTAMGIPAGARRVVQASASADGTGSYAFQFHSAGDSEEEAWTLHGWGRVTRDKEPLAPGSDQVEAWRAACTREVPLADVYDKLEAQGYTYGPSFRGLQALSVGDRQAYGEVRPPEGLGEADRYGIHPAVLDSCFHVLLGGLVVCESGDTTDVYVPTRMGRVRWAGVPAYPLRCHARWEPSGDEASGWGEAIAAHVTVVDAEGRICLEVTDFEARPVSRELLRADDQEDWHDWLYRVRWTEQALEDAASATPGNWLVLCDAGPEGVGARLARVIEQRGGSCTLLRSSTDADGEAVSRQVQKALEEQARDGVLYLWSLDASPPEHGDPDGLRQAVDQHTDWVVGMLRGAQGAEVTKRPRLWVATRGAHAVDADGEPVQQVAHAPLWGLARVAAHEHPDDWGGIVDLESAPSDKEPELLLSAVTQSSEDQIALRADAIYVPRLVRSRPPLGALRGPRFRQDGTYLIIGGLGGLGLSVARWLVDKGAGHIALMGRSEPREAARAEIDALRERGAQVAVLQGDVSDRNSLEAALADGLKSHPPLRGIFHSAAVVRDALLIQQEREALQTMLRPKVTGSWNLHQLSQDLELDYFVLFSSFTSLAGTPGQGGYSAGNAFQDALAQYRAARGQHALSINWGRWAEVGIAANLEAAGATQAKRWESWGIDPIAPGQAFVALEHLLSDDEPQVAVASIRWTDFLQNFPGADSALFSAVGDAPKGEQPKADEPEVDEALLAELQEADPDARRARLVEYVQQLSAAALGMSSSRPPSTNRPLMDQGLDSLLAVRLRSRLEKSLGCSLPASLIVEHPTIEAIAEFLQELLSERN